MEKILMDFEIKEYPDVNSRKEDPNPVLPIDFYDNDDGFWDEYISYKRQRLSENKLIVNRIYLKHWVPHRDSWLYLTFLNFKIKINN